MKKVVFFIVSVALISALFLSFGMAPRELDASKVNARAAYVVEANSNTMIFEQDSKSKYPIASMVKIMTALISFENIDKGTISLEDEVTISESAAGMGGSQMFLQANKVYKINDLMKGIVVVSANDASVAMAELIAGTEEDFIVLMNGRAKELGMNNTHFANCTGLPAPSNYSCAEDVAKMTIELIKHKDYYNYSTIWMEDFKHPDGTITGLTNTNKLIRFYDGCDGGKTGFTSEALFCLSASAQRDGMRVISVVLGAPNSKIRFAESSKLLNVAFAKYQNQLIFDKDNFFVDSLNIKGGKADQIHLELDQSVYSLVKKGETKEYDSKVELNMHIKAPIKKGEQVGVLYVIDNGVVIQERAIISSENIQEANYWDYIKKVVNQW